MYGEILFGLGCFAIGYLCGIGTIITILLKGMKSLSRKMKPKP